MIKTNYKINLKIYLICKHMTTNYLIDDTMTPDNQKYVCISFLKSPEENDKMYGIKFRGAFSTYDEACDHAKKLQKADSYHNVYVGETGKWLPFAPDENSKEAGNPEYDNEKLNKIMKAHMDNQEKAKLYHHYQKNEMLMKNHDENISNSKSQLEELKKQIAEEDDEDELKLLKLRLESLNKQIESLEKKKKKCNKNLKKTRKELDDMNVNV